MLARLSIETQHQHMAIDESLLAPLTPPSQDSYRHFLARIYGFEAPLGCVLASTPGLDAAFVVPRLRAGWLATDLLALGLTPTEAAMLRLRHSVPTFESGAEALGWLYVVERTTLRHDLIQRRVQAAIPDVLAVASAYLTSYRTRVHQAWNELGAMLDRTAHSIVIADQIVAAAKAAFSSQREWLERTA